MKLKKFLRLINEEVTKNPDLLNATVVYAIDNEGNAFHKVKTTATPGNFRGSNFDITNDNPDAICIN